jgi:hypothetical protein
MAARLVIRTVESEKNSRYSFLFEAKSAPAIVRTERLGKLQNSNDLIGNRTHDLPVYHSQTPQMQEMGGH